MVEQMNVSSAPLGPPHSFLLVLNAEPWQMAMLVSIVTASVIYYAFVTVATYRVSRTLHPFLLFLSEGAANCYTLATLVLCYAGQLFHARPLGDDATEVFISTLITYPSHLHYLLIAVNRGCAVFFPLKYNSWWSRSRTIVSLALVGVMGCSVEMVNVVHYVSTRRIPLFLPLYANVQRCVTYPSLAIYGASLCWVLLIRLRLYIRRHRSNGADTLQSSVADVSAQAIDVRIFAYCFLSFMPNCYYMVAAPVPNSMHMQLYIVFRLASNAVLLYAMSSPVRERMPLGLDYTRWLQLWCAQTPATTTPIVQMQMNRTDVTPALQRVYHQKCQASIAGSVPAV